MSFPEGLSFDVIVPRERVTEDWLHDLYYGFWARGADVVSGGHEATERTDVSWSAALDSPDLEIELPAQANSSGAPTLRGLLGALASLAGGDSGGCELWYGDCQLFLGLSADISAAGGSGEPVAEVAPVIWVGLSVERQHISPYLTRRGGPYLEVYRSFAGACVTLCELAAPLYGYGYEDGAWRDPTGDAAGMEDSRTLATVLRGELPDHGEVFLEEPLRYLPEALASAEAITGALKTPGTAVTRLTTGGVFIAPPLRGFSEADEEATRLYFAAWDTLNTLEYARASGGHSAALSAGPAAQALEALQRCERARALWETSGNRPCLAYADSCIHGLRALLGR